MKYIVCTRIGFVKYICAMYVYICLGREDGIVKFCIGIAWCCLEHICIILNLIIL